MSYSIYHWLETLLILWTTRKNGLMRGNAIT